MTLAWDEASTGKVNEEHTATLTFKENNTFFVNCIDC